VQSSPHRSLGLEVAVKVKLYGVRVDPLTIDEAVARGEESIEQRRPVHHALINREPFLSTIRGPRPGSAATPHPAVAEPDVLERVSVSLVRRGRGVCAS